MPSSYCWNQREKQGERESSDWLDLMTVEENRNSGILEVEGLFNSIESRSPDVTFELLLYLLL